MSTHSADRTGVWGAARAVVTHPAFARATLALIVANAALMGVETYAAVTAGREAFFRALHAGFQAAFVLEIALRIAACMPRPGRFFQDGWNVFDFAVVALSLLPAAGPLATVARIARVLRIARLASALPDLRLIVDTMLRSIPSMTHVVLMQALLVYVYAVLGCHLFGAADPERWGTLGRACTTLFQVLTLEAWSEMLEPAMAGSRAAWFFFASYIVVGVFVLINLFIAVVLNNLEKSRRQAEDEAREAALGSDVESRLAAAEKALTDLRAVLDRRAAR